MKRYFALLLAVVTLLSGCDRFSTEEEYYVLYMDTVVVDEAGEPIQGIYAYPEGDEFSGRTGYSDHLGKISAFGHIRPRGSFVIHFDDIDGEYNGGAYESVTVDIRGLVTPPSAPDQYGFTGSGVATIEKVVMKRK